MRFNPLDFLYHLKQIVTGRNGDDVAVPGGNLPGTSTAVLSSSQSADGGIKVDKVVPLSAVVNPADFPAITDSTVGTPSTTFAALTGTYATDVVTLRNILSQVALQFNALHTNFGSSVSSMPAIVVPATGTVIGTFSFAVPRDYDEASDHLAVFLEANLAAADAGITITGTATVAPIASQTGTAIVDATKTAVTATAPFSTTTLNVTQTVQVFSINLSGYGLKRNDIVAVALAFAGTTSGNANVYSIFRHYDSTLVSYNETDATQSPNGTIANVLPGFGNPLR